jgi:hypothetical protein
LVSETVEEVACAVTLSSPSGKGIGRSIAPRIHNQGVSFVFASPGTYSLPGDHTLGAGSDGTSYWVSFEE